MLSVKNCGKIKQMALDNYISWLSEILEQPIEPNENFLDVGGNSMIAISLNNKLKQEFNLLLSMEHLYNETLESAFNKS